MMKSVYYRENIECFGTERWSDMKKRFLHRFISAITSLGFLFSVYHFFTDNMKKTNSITAFKAVIS